MWRLMKIFYFWSHFHINLYVKLFSKEVAYFDPDPISAFLIPLSKKYGNIYSKEEQVLCFTEVLQLQYSYEYAN